MKVRSTAVAGMFYPGEPSHLEQLLSRFFQNRHDSGDATGIVAPHAGYVYSGEVASVAYAAIPSSFSGTFVVLGPSHQGYSTCSSAVDWETPLGIVDNDRDFVRALGIVVDEASHEDEQGCCDRSEADQDGQAGGCGVDSHTAGNGWRSGSGAVQRSHRGRIV